VADRPVGIPRGDRRGGHQLLRPLGPPLLAAGHDRRNSGHDRQTR